MPNCGCFPVNHTSPGPKPPSGYSKIKPDGDKCVVGGGYASDWAYPCTDYFYPVRNCLSAIRSARHQHSSSRAVPLPAEDQPDVTHDPCARILQIRVE